ncbi:hypothetical protein NX059_008879 [Plenodomus lindquistii]|nr:hypothetical protein NX059_008879 [Plenodomus lindquistii]
MYTRDEIDAALDKKIVKLTGPENYNGWLLHFQPLACANDFLDLYLGLDAVMTKPTSPDFGLDIYDNEEALADYKLDRMLFNFKAQEWTENAKLTRSACAFLRSSVESWIWDRLSAADAAHPTRAWNAIATANQASESVRLQRLLSDMNNIKISDPCAVMPFLLQFERVYKGIQDAKGTFTRSQMIDKMNAALPRQYEYFIQDWYLGERSRQTGEEVFQRYYCPRLLQWAECNNYRWQYDKKREAKQKSKKPQWLRDQEKAKKKSLYSTDKSFHCDHCNHVGHTVGTCRYFDKPDVAKCCLCNKLGHTEDVCRKKREHLIDGSTSRGDGDPFVADKRKSSRVNAIAPSAFILPDESHDATLANDLMFLRIQNQIPRLETQSNQTNSPLFRLPAELRNTIYKFALQDAIVSFTLERHSTSPSENQIAAEERMSNLKRPCGQTPSLLFACRQMYHEARPLVFSHCAFHFEDNLINDPQVTSYYAQIHILQLSLKLIGLWKRQTWFEGPDIAHLHRASQTQPNSNFPALEQCVLDLSSPLMEYVVKDVLGTNVCSG